MMGMRTGLAPRAGRVSTEAKGRLGCAEEPEEFRSQSFTFRANVVDSPGDSAFSS